MQRWCRPVSPDVTLDDHYSRSGTALAILRRTRHHHRHHEPACTTSAYTKKIRQSRSLRLANTRSHHAGERQRGHQVESHSPALSSASTTAYDDLLAEVVETIADARAALVSSHEQPCGSSGLADWPRNFGSAKRCRLRHGGRRSTGVGPVVPVPWPTRSSPRNLWYMRNFAIAWESEQILQTRLQNLSWSHHQVLLDSLADTQRASMVPRCGDRQPLVGASPHGSDSRRPLRTNRASTVELRCDTARSQRGRSRTPRN